MLIVGDRISVLHGSKETTAEDENTDDGDMAVEADDVAPPSSVQSEDEAWKRNTRLLLYSFAVSGVYVSETS